MRGSIALLALALLLAACQSRRDPQLERGRAAIDHYGCGPLTGIGARQYVAGMLTNTRDNLASWIRNPKAINPKTAMPVLGVSEQDAGDIAAYLSRQ
jgi:cytochrome c1